MFLLNSIRDYAVRSVLRRREHNLPVYASIAAATALPVIVLALDSVIEAQGAAFVGVDSGRELVNATRLLAGMGVIVGLLQIQLLIGRLIKSRTRELRLLVSIAAPPVTVLLIVVCENFIHTVIGSTIGIIGALAVVITVALIHNDVTLPALATLCGIGAGAFVIAVMSIVTSSVVSVWAVSMETSLTTDRI